MADISKIKLPDNSVVNIKDYRIPGVDSTPTSGSDNVVTSDGIYDSLRTDNIKPIDTHIYENIVAASPINTLRPFMRVIPTNWDEPCIVTYRVRVYVSGHEDLYYSKHECEFAFFHESILGYYTKNYIGNTSYRTIYYNSLMRCYAAYKTIGHLIGFNYYDAGNSYSRACSTSGYGRTFVIEILNLDNCTIEWLSSCDAVSASIVEGYVAGTSHYAITNYDGTTQGITISGDRNTNTIGYFIRYSGITLPVTAKTYRYRILFSNKERTAWIPSNTSTSTNATAQRDVNQIPIDPFGPIVYYSTTTALAANGLPGATNIWTQYTVTFGYSFNRTGAALTLTYPAPIYIKCAPQSDGTAIIDADTPYVQSLPTTNDGKIYIYIGNAYSATAMELTQDKPVYYHDGNRIRLWTDAERPVTSISALSTDIEYPSAKAVYDTINSSISTALTSALKYKGTIGSEGTVTSLPASHKVGDIYVVATNGTYAGKACEVGDYIICKTDGTSANDAHWDVINGENQVSQSNSEFTTDAASKALAVIDGTTLNLKVTHHTPSGGSAMSSSAGSDVGWGGSVITGLTSDGKGHITGVTTGAIPVSGTLNTTATAAQSTNSSEALSGSITLHKVSKTGNYNDLLNKPIILNNVFVAESGITTYNEVMQACLAKRIVFAWDNAAELMEFYPLVEYNDDSNTFYFLKIRDRYCYDYLTLNNNDEWDSDYEPLSIKTINNTSLIGSGNLTVVTDVSGKEDKSNKVTYISNASTDTNYPSAKAVNTALSTKANLNGDISEDFSVEKLNLASEGTGGNATTEGVWDDGELSLNSSKKLEVKYKVSVIEEGASEPTASVVTKTVAYTTDLPDLSGKQDVLISGTNIKTVNNESLLGSGNVTVADGKSAYQLWLEAGNSGTLQQFLASLQGNSGYTGNLNELEIVNDLTTGGTTKALSAQMGVQLKADLDGKFIFLSESEFEALTVLDQNKIYCTYEDDI